MVLLRTEYEILTSFYLMPLGIAHKFRRPIEMRCYGYYAFLRCRNLVRKTFAIQSVEGNNNL